jgi:hypothetical protein
MVDDGGDRPEVSLLFAVAAGTYLRRVARYQSIFCGNAKIMRNSVQACLTFPIASAHPT